MYNDAMQSQNAQFQGQGQTNGQMPFQDNFNGMMGMNGMDPSQMNFMPNMMGKLNVSDELSNSDADINYAGMPGMNFGMGMGMGSGNMDPSMMFGNFGGMGMNDMQSMMNMMGMNGMGDMNNFGGMGGPGFFPQGNYMQSNFNGNNQHQPPFFNNDFNQGRGRPYGRGFGRGRGQYARGRGRGGGFGYGYEPQFGQQGQPYNQGGYDQGGPQQQQQQQFDAHDEQTDVPLRRASPTYEAVPGGKESSVAEAHHGEASNDGAHPTERAGTDQEGEKTNDAGDVAIEHDDARTHEHQASGGHGPTSDMAGQDFSDNGNGPAHMHAYGDYAPHEEQHQDYNMQYHDQNGHNGMGRGNFRGGYGRGRGGFNNFYARGQDNTELTPKPAPPLNAPTGPKALREGRPNTGWSGLRAAGQSAQRPVSRAAGNAIDQEHVESIHKETDRESEVQIARTNRSLNGETDRARSKSRSRSRARNGRNRDRSQSVEGESDGSYSRRKDRDRERRRRKERSRRYEDDEYPRSKDEDEPRRKHRSRSESPVEDGSHRRRRDKVDDHRSSRSQRDRSKDKHKRRHRSRSPDRDDADKHDDYSSRRKSKSHRDEDQYEGRDKESRSSRKHSRRDDEEYGDDKHGHSHRSSRNDDRDRDSKRTGRHRESESLRAVIEPPSDELGFKIKGSKSAKSGSHKDREARSSHQEPTSNAASSDPYAEERARAQQNRVAAEAQRRQSSSLGKRGRGDEVIDAPTGPRGMTNSSSSRSKKVRKETRQINYKYEDEIGEDERDAGRWR